MESTSHRIAGADGLQIHVLEWSSEGVPLILLHGHGNEAHLWDDFVPKITDHYRVLALDQRGHGDSDWDPEGRYDAEHMAKDLEAVLDAFEIDRFVLVGFSMGGRVSMQFASQYPERLAGLVLVDIGPELDRRGTMRIGGEMEAQRNPTFASLEEYARMLSMNYPAGQPEALMRMAQHGLKQGDDGRYALKMDPKLRSDRPQDAASIAKEEAFTQLQWDTLGTLPCPALVVRGAASDILSPDIADKMVDEVIPNATLAVVPQAAHSVATDNPEGFAEAVCAFVLG